MRPTLYIIVGISGSGKSTWVRNHAKGLVVNADTLRQMLTGPWYHPGWEHVLWAVEENLIETVCRRAVLVGANVYIDELNLTREQRKRYIGLAAAHGMRPVAVFVDAALETARQRNQERSTGISGLVVAKMKAMLEPPNLEEGFAEIVVLNEDGKVVRRYVRERTNAGELTGQRDAA